MTTKVTKERYNKINNQKQNDFFNTFIIFASFDSIMYTLDTINFTIFI